MSFDTLNLNMFDVSINKSKKERKNQNIDYRSCHWDGCTDPGICKAPRSPSNLREYFWFCQKHACFYNKSWSFSSSGHSESREEKTNKKQFCYRDERDLSLTYRRSISELYSNKNGIQSYNEYQKNERLPYTNLEKRALSILRLNCSASNYDIRRAYLDLIKKLHPDMNQGKRITESRLCSVISAYRILKKKNS